MKEKIFIYLREQESMQVTWLTMDKENRMSTVDHADVGNAEFLTTAAINKDVYVLVPGCDVSLFVTEMPKMNQTKMRAALPFALEDKLVADVATLHFAMSQFSTAETAVAVVAIEKMQQWLNILQVLKIQPDFFVPVTLALPVKENHWHVFCHDKYAVVRMGLVQGFACEQDNLSSMLKLALAETTQQPSSILVSHYGETIASALPSPLPLQEEQDEQEKFFADCAVNVCCFPFINLLQGSFAVKKRKTIPQRKMTFIATTSAFVLIFALFVYPVISYFILRPKLNEVENQIKEIYLRHFPQAKNITAPRLRMEEELRKISQEGNNNRFIFLLANVVEGMKNSPNVKLKQFTFQQHQLTLELSASSSEDFSALVHFLGQQGLTIKNQTANLIDGHIETSLSLE